MNSSATETTSELDDLRKTHAEKVIWELRRATIAAFDLVAELTAARADGDEWTRMPRPKERCPVSQFSRSKVERLIAQDFVRAKTVAGGRYYSLADVRKLLKGDHDVPE